MVTTGLGFLREAFPGPCLPGTQIDARYHITPCYVPTAFTTIYSFCVFRVSCPKRAGPLRVSPLRYPQCLAYGRGSRCSMKQVHFTRNRRTLLGLGWAGLKLPLLPLKAKSGLRRRPVGAGPAAQASSQTRPPFSHSVAHLQTARLRDLLMN